MSNEITKAICKIFNQGREREIGGKFYRAVREHYLPVYGSSYTGPEYSGHLVWVRQVAHRQDGWGSGRRVTDTWEPEFSQDHWVIEITDTGYLVYQAELSGSLNDLSLGLSDDTAKVAFLDAETAVRCVVDALTPKPAPTKPARKRAPRKLAAVKD